MDIASTSSASSSSLGSYASTSVTGLVDGINVDSIVSGLMVSERAPEDTLVQQVQTLKWQQADYRTINTDLQALQSGLSSLELQGTFLTKEVSSSSSAVTATAATSALDTSHTIAVSSVATNAVLASSNAISSITSTSSDLSSVLSGLSTDSSGDVDFSISDGATTKTFSIDPSTATLGTLVSDINDSSNGLNVQASWDSTLQRFYLTNTETGQTVTAEDTGGNLMQQLFDPSSTATPGTYSTSASGSDAAVKVDGTSYTFDSNQFAINGVSYSIQGTTASGESAYVTVTNSVSSVVSAVQGFVTLYNSTLSGLNSMLDQEVYSGYEPLTTDMINEKGLDSTEVDAWNTKAQSGLLNNDPLLQSVVNDMSNAMNNPVSGLSGTVTITNSRSEETTVTCNQMGDIGLTSSNGKLSLDTTRLTEALQSNPTAVMDLFTNQLTSGGSLITDSSQQGLAVRLYNTLSSSISQITNQAGSSSNAVDNSYIGTQISSDDTRISNWDTYLSGLEKQYFTEYDAMETTLSELNSQSSWLTQEFSGSSS
jgi:flagellar hook-associated protein 2